MGCVMDLGVLRIGSGAVRSPRLSKRREKQWQVKNGILDHSKFFSNAMRGKTI